MKKVGVLTFPGTNCDRDVHAWLEARGYKTQALWHLDRFDETDFEALVLPGGFSYGDYLRSGALAALSPAMNSVRAFAERGGPVLGICNGFQILCEAKLLPGALVQNRDRRFLDDWFELEIRNPNSFFATGYARGARIRLPIAHGDGRYYATSDQLKNIYDNDQVWLTYTECPNGSVGDIAGIFNERKNVAGLMPHPERALYAWMGGQDGWEFL